MSVVSFRRNRRTGTLVSVVDNRDGSFECEGYGDEPDAAPEGCTWATVCEDHGTYVLHASRKLAVWFAPCPDEWCEECRELVELGRKYDRQARVIA